MSEDKKFDDEDDMDLDGLDMEDVEIEFDTVTMVDDDGNETEFVIIDEVEHNNAKYVLMVKSDEAEDEESDAMIFKQVGEDADQFVYEELGDEEFETIAKILSERIDDYEIDF